MSKRPRSQLDEKQQKHCCLFLVWTSELYYEDCIDKLSRMSHARSKALHVMMEAAIKLRIKSQTLASACIYFHRFHSSASFDKDEPRYEPMLLAASCISLATKVQEDQVGLRDIINVFHRSLHPDQAPLDLGPIYWSLRDSISHLEMILLRFLQFQVTIDQPHRYLLHYLSSLGSWVQCGLEDRLLLAKVSWSILSDFNLNPICISHDPSAVAISVLYLALKIVPISIPFEHSSQTSWNEALNEKVSKEKISEIIGDIISLYE